MFFEDYKNKHINYEELKNRDATLKDFGLKKQDLNNIEEIENKVSNYQNRSSWSPLVSYVLSFSLGLMVAFGLQEFSDSITKPASGVIGIILGFVFYFITTKMTGELAIPTSSEMSIYERYKKYSNNDLDRKKLIKKAERKAFKDYIRSEYKRVQKKKNKIEEHDQDIIELEEKIQSIDEGKLDDLKNLTPNEFEKRIHYIFEQMGYNATLTSATGDGGVDIILHDIDGKIYVECKKYNGTVSSHELKKFLGTLTHDEIEKGIFVTTGTYSEKAKQIAEKRNIELLDGQELVSLISEEIGDESEKQQLSESIDQIRMERNKCNAQILDLNIPDNTEYHYDIGIPKEQIENNYLEKLEEIEEFEDEVDYSTNRKCRQLKRHVSEAYNGLMND